LFPPLFRTMLLFCCSQILLLQRIFYKKTLFNSSLLELQKFCNCHLSVEMGSSSIFPFCWSINITKSIKCQSVEQTSLLPVVTECCFHQFSCTSTNMAMAIRLWNNSSIIQQPFTPLHMIVT